MDASGTIEDSYMSWFQVENVERSFSYNNLILIK